MPKKYPVEVRLFAVQKKAEGHSWDRVAEMVMQNFGFDRPPSRRQMTKWVKTGDAIPNLMLEQIKSRLPAFAPGWLSTQQELMGKLYTEWMMGKDPNLVLAKAFLSQLRGFIGPEKLRMALDEFAREEKQHEQEVMPPAINPKLEEGGGTK